MKTTFNVPDDVLAEAKAVAAKRKTTLTNLVINSLLREIGINRSEPLSDERFEIGPLGIFRLKKRESTMNSAKVRQLQKKADAEEMANALIARKRKNTR